MPPRSIPHVPSTRAKDNALRRCLERAARQFRCNEYAAGVLFSFILEAITDELADGVEVVVPGFGRFGHYMKQPRKPGLSPYVQPTFDASKPLNDRIKRQTRPCELALERRERYRKNHASFSRNSQVGGSDPRSALAAERKKLRHEAQRDGLDADEFNGYAKEPTWRRRQRERAERRDRLRRWRHPRG